MFRRLAALVPALALALACGVAHAGDGFPVLIIKQKDKSAAGDVLRTISVVASGSAATDAAWVEVEVNGSSAWRIYPTSAEITGVGLVAFAGEPGATTYEASMTVTGVDGAALWSGTGKVAMDGALVVPTGTGAKGRDVAAAGLRAFPTSDPGVFDVVLTLVGNDVVDAAGVTLSLVGGDKSAPIDAKVEMALGEPRRHFDAPATYEGYPGDSQIQFQVEAFDKRGKKVAKEKGEYVATQLVGADGRPGGIELLPAGGGDEPLPRGDILIGGEPIDIE